MKHCGEPVKHTTTGWCSCCGATHNYVPIWRVIRPRTAQAAMTLLWLRARALGVAFAESVMRVGR